MPSAFSECLARARERAGFKTAHEFFAHSGGAKVLRLSFTAYLRMERGLILPKPERLKTLVACLRLLPPSAWTLELVRAYHATLMGSEETHQWVLAMLSPKKSAKPAGMTERAVERAVHAETYNLSHKQALAAEADYASFWSWTLLCVDAAAWKVAKLAKHLGISRAELMTGLKGLAKAGLIEFPDKDSVRCPMAGRHFKHPPALLESESERERWRGYQTRMLKSRGTLVWHTYSLPRADELELRNHYFPHMSRAVGDVHVYAKHEREPADPPTPLFLVEGRVYRISL